MNPTERDLERLGAGTLLEIRKEAAAWLIEMDLNPDRWDRRDFSLWLKSSPRHMEEFLEQTALWVALHGMKPGKIDVDHVLRESNSIIDWPEAAIGREQTSHKHAKANRRRSLSWAAAILISIAGAIFLWQSADDRMVLATAIGEQRAVKLADHSVMHLNTNSRAEVRFTESVREIHLTQGEALFTVERDTRRPFKVYAQGIEVEAIGTQFNVRLRASEALVAVVEGRVAVLTTDTAMSQPDNEPKPTYSPDGKSVDRTAHPRTILAAGEQARVTQSGALEHKPMENIVTATAWRQRQLVFHQTPFAEVAEEVARYNVSPRLRFEGEALRSRRLDGVFAADDPETLIQFLLQDPELLVVRRGEDVIIRRH